MNNPKLIVMSGLPGSGKSTIAEHIASKLSIAVLSVDPIESAILKSGIQRSFTTGLAAYLVAETLAEEQLKLGNTVIVDAVNAEEEGKQTWLNVSRKQGVPLLVIECENSNLELHQKRVLARRRSLHGIPEVSWNDVEDRRKKFTNWNVSTLKIDTSKSFSHNVERILLYIGTNT